LKNIRDRFSNDEISIPFPRQYAAKIAVLFNGLGLRIELNQGIAKYRPNLMDVIINQSPTKLYCFTSKRFHSSNSNYFVFHLGIGVFRQLCFKATCRAMKTMQPSAVSEATTWAITPGMMLVFREFLQQQVSSFYPPFSKRHIAVLFRDLSKMMPKDYNDEDLQDTDESTENNADLSTLLQSAPSLDDVDKQ
jgi:hypothetical protein